jgi:Immunoglobulin I-set domain
LSISTAPRIIVDLTNMTVLAGATATLRVTANGSGPLTYQWQLNGVPISGATADSLTLTSVTGQESGSYQVIVQNSFGEAESSMVSLNVMAPNSLKISPLDANQFKLTFAGVPLQNYVVQYSSNFSGGWVFAGYATADATGTVVFMAPRSGPSTFYRFAPAGASSQTPSASAKLMNSGL